ncbi:MAG: DEAD/DEAH box helicase [Candidatus Aenigmarchaeota archaeon]|nr:DEAD/DEAH box helicase [Candidatus Aenigmarchaeota archaeon]
MDAIREALERSGYAQLNPVQELAVPKLGRSLVVAAPTASGKTLVAEIAALQAFAERRKVVYLVPLRALAQEKYEEFKQKYEPLGVKVALSTGDLDATDSWLANYDLIIATSEKMDSLLRHGIAWAKDIGLVVADELHLLHDPGRGPTLEIVLTRLRAFQPRFLGLSATIPNYQELADWLGAEAVQSSWRPVPLYKGVCYDQEVTFQPPRGFKLQGSKVLEELTDLPKQSLVFISSRKGTEAEAERLAATIKKRLTPEEEGKLAELGDRIVHALDNATPQCQRLAACVRAGTAFHHAGLTHAQRSLVEHAFRAGTIKLLCATSTLAAGLNLPAYRVIIRDLKRFSSFRGMDFLPSLEIAQMMGRAGRPKYDKEGEAILLPKNQREAEYSWSQYIQGETEKIYSKLGVEPVLRTHVLALIAGGVTTTRKGLLEFFSRTFYAHQYKDLTQITRHLDAVLRQLEGFGFIRTGEALPAPAGGEVFKPAYFWEEEDPHLEATLLGRRIAELYIDPLSADFLVRTLRKLRGGSTFTFLHLAANCLEMRPGLSLRKQDFEVADQALAEKEGELAAPVPNAWDLEYEDFLRNLKMALFLEAWADEAGEDALYEQHGVTPGELRARLDIADWLLYSAGELAVLLGLQPLLTHLRKARLRLRYGIREELLPLVRLKGVGRARARKLWASGLRSLADLRKVPLQSLGRIVGEGTASSLKEQLGQLGDQPTEETLLPRKLE